MRRVLGQRGELQRQAFAEAARADARRLEVLQVLQRDLQLVELDFQLGRQERDQFFQALREVAVVVQRIDQQRDQPLVALGEVGERELPQQVRAQGGGVGGDLLVFAVLGIVAVAGRRARRPAS